MTGMIGALGAIFQSWPVDWNNANIDKAAGKDIDDTDKIAHHTSRVTCAFKCPLDSKDNQKMTNKKDGDGWYEVSHSKEVEC